MEAMVSKVRHFLKQLSARYDMRSLVFWEVVSGIILSVSLMFLFLSISGAVLDHQTVFFDNSISKYIYSLRQPWLTNMMILISLLGEQMLIFLAIFVIVLLTMKSHKKEMFVFIILLIIGLIATSLLKISFKVPRPEGFALIKINSYSFPSGHALNSVLFYGVLAYFAFHFTKSKALTICAVLASVVLVFLIGVSRVYLGVHRPSDVVAGDIVGFWLLVTVILIDKTIQYFKLVKEPKKS